MLKRYKTHVTLHAAPFSPRDYGRFPSGTHAAVPPPSRISHCTQFQTPFHCNPITIKSVILHKLTTKHVRSPTADSRDQLLVETGRWVLTSTNMSLQYV